MNNSSVFFLCILIFVSCTNKKERNFKPIENSNEGKTRFTFSQEFDVDFMISEGGALILYDFSKPIDTLFNYSGAHLIGKDSIIYVRIRKSTDVPEQENDFYFGDCVGLFLFDGFKMNQLNLPYFDPMFSSFCVKDKIIYYWGFSSNGSSLYAVQYNFITKKVIKKDLDFENATDNYGNFYAPRIEGKKVYFETESSNSNSNRVFRTETMKPILNQ